MPSPNSQNPSTQSDDPGLSSNSRTNPLKHEGLRFASRLKLPESPRKRKRRDTPEPSQPPRVLSEAERLEETAWKEVAETGKPIFFNGTLLLPEGMSLHEAVEFLPADIRESARQGLDKTSTEIFQILIRGARRQIREELAEQGNLASYDALPEAGKMALDEFVIRQQMGYPEVPLEALIERNAGKNNSVSEPTNQPTQELESNEAVKGVLPTDDRIFEFDKLQLGELITKVERSSKKGQALLWNIEHHRLLLKRLNEIWEHMNIEEKQSILAFLEKRIRKAEIDQIDEIIKGFEWVRMIGERKGEGET